MMQTLAEGWWCRKCEVFEQDDEIDTEIEICRCCGCYGAEHLPVEIITKGLV